MLSLLGVVHNFFKIITHQSINNLIKICGIKESLGKPNMCHYCLRLQSVLKGSARMQLREADE